MPRLATIDEYLATVRDDQRAALEKVRKAIRAAAPGAEECISYQLPAFRHNGKALVAFGATANHCPFFPMSSLTVKAHKKELEGYETSKGTVRFQPDRPLPAGLVKKLVKSRLAENARQTEKTNRGKSTATRAESGRKVAGAKAKTSATARRSGRAQFQGFLK
jgi:uncharacterized protein YdhG (YjbR/CyaY superfamily)